MMNASLAARRIPAILLDAAFVAAIAAVMVLGAPKQALAYVDPSVITYAVQAIAGVAVGISAVIGVVWRKFRRKVNRLLKVDENAGKTIDPEVRRIDPSEKAFVDADAREDEAAEYEKIRANENALSQAKFGKRLVVSAIVSLFAVYTLFFVAPMEIVAGNGESLYFSVGKLWPIMAVFAFAVALALTLLLSAFRGKPFVVALALILGFGVCCYLQAMFLNVSLPAADGSQLNLQWHKTIATISAAVWIAVMSAVMVFAFKKQRLFRSTALFVSVALIFVQTCAVASLFMNDAPKFRATEEGMFTVSGGDNVILIVLDTTDNKYMNEILAEHPEVFDELDGFTYYTDVTGSMIPTRYGVPFLMTGEVPQIGEDFDTYKKERYNRGNMLQQFYDQGYNIGIYSSLGTEGIAEYTVNMHEFDPEVYVQGVVPILAKCALYRDLPWVFKGPFWFYTDQVNKELAGPVDYANVDFVNTPYTFDDHKFYHTLLESRLQVDEGAENGAFRLLHLEGSHYPFIIDENAELVEDGGAVTQVQQTIGVMKMVSEYLSQLKELGVYDDATIIITSDHGDWYLTPDPITFPSSPILMYKPANSQVEGMAVSSLPASHFEVPATLLAAIGGDLSGYGITLEDLQEGERERLYYMTSSNGVDDTVIREFLIKGDVLDFENWELTGNEWQLVEE